MRELKLSALAFGLLLFLVVAGWGYAQGTSPPLIDILGQPENAPPEAYLYVSVVDPETGRFIEGLSEPNFAVTVDGEEVAPQVSTETTGVAVVMVIDRGGIARRGDPRIGDAVGLADALLQKLHVDGSPNADMVALLGIRGRDSGGITPTVQFTDYDPNAVRNEFDRLRIEVVPETTPLYDGIDKAIEWIIENGDAAIQEKLEHRRPIIVVFSDGIDRQYSNEAHETVIIDKCKEHGILIYAVRMEARGRATDADNLEALATQTGGLYITHNEETHEQVLGLFDDFITQRQTYRVAYPVYKERGNYSVGVQVLDTPIGDSKEVKVEGYSALQVPELTLTTPAEGTRYTVPYSQTLKGFVEVDINLSVQIETPDGVPRDPEKVEYYANGTLIGSSTTGPDFPFTWRVSDWTTPTEQAQSEGFTLIASAEDPYLHREMNSDPVTIRVTWEAKEVPVVEGAVEEARQNWWVILALVFMVLMLLVLFFLLLRTRGEMARRVVTSTTGVLKSVTRRLGPMPQQAPGKLVIIQGANVGREFRLAAQVVKVGRDPQFCDFALYDEYVSNPHFSVHQEQGLFYIVDEGSTNGTKVNSVPLTPHQRIPLEPDAIIEVGQTRLQFKRIGGTTRVLGG